MLDCGGRPLDLGRVAIMGILNITPDSFSDGGVFLSPAKAVDHASGDVAPTDKAPRARPSKAKPCLVDYMQAAIKKCRVAGRECWGFTFVTDLFYWCKQRLIAADQIDLFTGDIPPPKISMGYHTRKQLEPCLLFKRGRAEAKAALE